MEIYCTGCEKYVSARLTNGEEMYPHRKDLYALPFWVCPDCPAFVGCHHKTSQPTRPLGVLATQKLKDERKKIHAVLDPLWKSGLIPRAKAYAYVSKKLGKEYHNAEIRTVEEAREVHKIVLELKESVSST